MLHINQTAAVGSERTDALQHGHPISWHSECPLPEQATSTLATAANVGNPPFLTSSRTARTGPWRHGSVMRRGSPKLPFMHWEAFRPLGGRLNFHKATGIVDKPRLPRFKA
jgi:hypothetical protein